MKVRFLFHNPKEESGVGKAIVAWTWALALFYNWKVLKYNYSHVEVWMADLNGEFGDVDNWKGICFSSTTRGNWKGVRFALAPEVLQHPERWDYIEVDVDSERYIVGLDEAAKLVGGGYDYGYILSFLQPFIVQKDEDWACSEICAWLGYLWRVIDRQYKRISPRRLAMVLGGNLIPIKGV